VVIGLQVSGSWVT